MKSTCMKELQLVQILSDEKGLTQRDIFLRLDMAQGLVNQYLKRLAQKGWIKLTTAPPKRMLYWLTPKGMTEKTRLTYEFVSVTFRLYKEAHKNASNALHRLAHREGVRRIAFYGAEPVAEIAAMSLKENKIDLIALVDEEAKGTTFMGMNVVGIDELDRLEFDAILFVKHSSLADSILLRLLATKGRTVNLFDITGHEPQDEPQAPSNKRDEEPS